MRVSAALAAQELRNHLREAEAAAPAAEPKRRRLAFRLRWSLAGR